MTDGIDRAAAEPLGALGQQFADLTRLLAADSATTTDPRRVVQFAVSGVPNAAQATLTLIRSGERPETVAATAEIAVDVDLLQYDVGEGPCLDAATGNDVVLVPDLTHEPRWPTFAARCVSEFPVRSMLCVRLPQGAAGRAAMNLYAMQPRLFTDLDVAVASMFAPFAALAVQSAAYEQDVHNLHEALTSSRVIGTAIGILMAHDNLTTEQAFDALRDASNHLNRKLRDVAAEVERTGTLPEPPTG